MPAQRQGRSRFADLVRPNAPGELATVLLDWLTDAHEEAARLQEFRAHNGRHPWANPYSYGTDRYQYLVGTASSLSRLVPDLTPDFSYRSLILKAGDAAIYPLRAKGNNPHGVMLDGSEWQRELGEASANYDGSMINRVEAIVGDREILFLPWSGESFLSGTWVGQGVLTPANTISWEWLHPLSDVLVAEFGVSAAIHESQPVETRTRETPRHESESNQPRTDIPALPDHSTESPPGHPHPASTGWRAAGEVSSPIQPMLWSGDEPPDL